MELSSDKEYIYNSSELDQHEGRIIEEMKAGSKETIADPDVWLDEEVKRNLVLTSVDWILDWARRSSPGQSFCSPACCVFEFIAA